VERAVFLLVKDTTATIGDLERYIQPVQRFSVRNASSLDCSAGDRGYILENLGLTSDIRLIV